MPGAEHPLSGRIEQWLLRPDLALDQLQGGCLRARRLGCVAVCVHGSNLVHASHFLGESPVRVAAAVGFPHGAADADVKRYETEVAVDHGAHEINLALQIARLKERNGPYLLREVRDVVEAADERPVKVLLDAEALAEEEMAQACSWLADSGARAVMVTAGFGAGRPTPEAVGRIRQQLSPDLIVIAAGAITDGTDALALLEAGAARLALNLDWFDQGGPATSGLATGQRDV